MSKNVLIVGSGAREHSIALKVAQSPRVGAIYITNPTAGTRQIAEGVESDLTTVSGLQRLARFAEEKLIDVTLVGPEAPLALGIVDLFASRGLRIWGPTAAAAEIESSKEFAKHFMRRHQIQTAPFVTFNDYAHAVAYVRRRRGRMIIKASGLASGKGVRRCRTRGEALRALDQLMVQRDCGDAGSTVIIEDWIDGRETSAHGFTDGTCVRYCPPTVDYKLLNGEMTGGMGCYGPAPWVNNMLRADVYDTVLRRTVDGLAREGRTFRGCLYPGLMVEREGRFKVLEFNSRMGDPEAQVYLSLLKTDILDIVDASLDGTLADLSIKWRDGYAVCIVLASEGYPHAPIVGREIRGIEIAERIPGVQVFHAATKLEDDGRIVTSGGRVLSVVACASTMEGARKQAYDAAPLILFQGKQMLDNIAADAH